MPDRRRCHGATGGRLRRSSPTTAAAASESPPVSAGASRRPRTILIAARSPSGDRRARVVEVVEIRLGALIVGILGDLREAPHELEQRHEVDEGDRGEVVPERVGRRPEGVRVVQGRVGENTWSTESVEAYHHLAVALHELNLDRDTRRGQGEALLAAGRQRRAIRTRSASSAAGGRRASGPRPDRRWSRPQTPRRCRTGRSPDEPAGVARPVLSWEPRSNPRASVRSEAAAPTALPEQRRYRHRRPRKQARSRSGKSLSSSDSSRPGPRGRAPRSPARGRRPSPTRRSHGLRRGLSTCGPAAAPRRSSAARLLERVDDCPRLGVGEVELVVGRASSLAVNSSEPASESPSEASTASLNACSGPPTTKSPTMPVTDPSLGNTR